MKVKLEDLPAVLVKMRKKRGYSQKRLAEILGLNAVTVARWEAAPIKLPWQWLVAIANALHLKITIMVDVKKPPKSEE